MTVPGWLTIVSWAALAVALVSSAIIATDIFGRGHRQQMRVMEAVWPITALYFGPAALVAYRHWARGGTGAETHHRSGSGGGKPFWASVAVGATHCGAGCTLGDLVAEWVVFAAGLRLAGFALPVEYPFDYVLALGLGIVFQYFAIAPMRDVSLGEGLKLAAKADFLSLTAFEEGLFGWMAVVQLVMFPGPHLPTDRAAFWFLMQVGMVVGFATTYPMNWWLIRRGVKEAM